MKKLIVMHARQTSEPRLQWLQQTVEQQAEGAACVLARTFPVQGDDAGAYDRWARELAKNLDGMVITSLHIGRATAKLANLMRVKGKDVKFFNGTDHLKTVKFIKEVNANDWKRGWMAIYG